MRRQADEWGLREECYLAQQESRSQTEPWGGNRNATFFTAADEFTTQMGGQKSCDSPLVHATRFQGQAAREEMGG